MALHRTKYIFRHGSLSMEGWALKNDDLIWIENDVFYAQPLPCISDVDEAVACLDHSGVRKLARFALKHKRGLPFPSVQGDGDAQRPALFWDNPRCGFARSYFFPSSSSTRGLAL